MSHYRLKDNYLRFYLKCIEPNKKKILKQPLKILPKWQVIMGLQFENLVLSNRNSIQQILNIDASEIVNDNPYFQRKSASQAGCQIDYMIQTKFGTCYLCDIKFSAQTLHVNVIDEIKEKIKNLKRPKNYSIRPVLIHVNGVSDEIIESEFFSSIIDFRLLFRKSRRLIKTFLLFNSANLADLFFSF